MPMKSTPQCRVALHAATAIVCSLASVGLLAAPVPAEDTATMAAAAQQVFGKQAGQSFDAHAVSRSSGATRTDTLTLTLAPGKGAEVKAAIEAGQGFVFQWKASAELAVDMHGELPEAKDEYTSYWIEGAQRQGAGTFVAKFSGHHGWYWRNNGKEPVTVQLTVTGFQAKVFRPGH